MSKAVQYGNTLKAHAAYLSRYQLLPYLRRQEYFSEQPDIPLSQGSLVNLNKEAFSCLLDFSAIAKDKLAGAEQIYADETGTNIEGKHHWLHCASNDGWTDFFAHEKRGCEAMNAEGLLPRFTGVLCHDHRKPSDRYEGCSHALCNAHHLRELTCVREQDEQAWAGKMKRLLEEMNHAVHKAGGSLAPDKARSYRSRYRRLLKQGQGECPPPEPSQHRGKRGRVKRSKARNLLERLIHYEEELLRFMENPGIPFTNDQGTAEDIRLFPL